MQKSYSLIISNANLPNFQHTFFILKLCFYFMQRINHMEEKCKCVKKQKIVQSWFSQVLSLLLSQFHYLTLSQSPNVKFRREKKDSFFFMCMISDQICHTMCIDQENKFNNLNRLFHCMVTDNSYE